MDRPSMHVRLSAASDRRNRGSRPECDPLRWGRLLVILWIGWVAVGIGSALAQDVPALTGRVVDNADILASTTEEVLTRQLSAHEDSTGNQVAVLTIESLNGAPIEDYALEVGRSWALGTSEFDNGVLLLVSVQDRRMRIEVGFGLEGALPDATADRIIRHEIRPRFRDGDFDSGVRSGVDAILSAIEGTYEPPARSSSEAPFRIIGLFMTLIGGLFGFGGCYAMLRHAAKAGVAGIIVTLFVFGPFMLGGLFVSFLGLGFLFFGGDTAWVIVPLLIGIPATCIVLVWHLILILRSDRVEARREKMEADESIEEGVQVGWIYLAPAVWSQIRSVGMSGGGFSSGGSGGFSGGFSSGGSGGGGFSGGGGSFGGGGASGSW